MRILDRYILRSVLSLFFGCLFVFFFLYIIIDIFSHLDEILRQHVHFIILIKYYASFLPIIFTQVAPFTCLIAVLYTFGKFNRNNEIIAMRASGMSIFQISKTIIIFGLLVTVFMFWLGDKFVPQSTATTERIKEQMETGTKKQQAKNQETITNLSIYGLKNRLFFVNKFQLSASMMENIVILEHDEKQNIVKKIVANKGIYKEGLWRFHQCITYNFDENGQIIDEPQYFDEEIMAIPETPREFLSQRQRPDIMTISQIEDYIWKLSKSGATTVIRNLKVDLYQRFTSPFTCFIMILIGIPFSLMMKKRATGMSSLGLSIMVGFLYYVVNAVSIALGKAGVLAPIISASFSHVVAFSASLFLITRLP